MKKNLYILLAATAALSLASCQKEAGTLPGNDTDPFAVLNTFSPEGNYDADCDVAVRFTANNATTDLYYLAEATAQKQARNMTDEQYAEYVVANGKKLSTSENPFNGSLTVDVVLEGLFGDNTISAVAVGANGKHLASTTFFGQQWNTVATGTYYFSKPAAFASLMGGASQENVQLQQNADNPDNFRFKNLFGAGRHLSIVVYPDYQNTDEDGTYTFFRIPAQPIYRTYGSYGDVSIRDLGYWQGDDGYVFDYGYESGMYEDYNCFIYAQFYVSAGSLGYGKSYFEPNN